MMREAEVVIIYLCLGAVAYVYFGYPLLLWLGAIGHRRAFLREASHPSVSVIVAAHDEECCIEHKLRNLLALDYPRDRIEILIGSDGSSDRTEEIVRRFAHEGVGLISFPRQHGKSAMQNSLISHSSGELLVFTDADCLLSPEALAHLIEHFADPRVGLVTGCPRFRNPGDSSVAANESVYLGYETWLRQRESEFGLLAMASGSLFAMRRSLWKPLDPRFGDDFVLPLRVLGAGLVNRLDRRAIATTNLTQTSPAAMLRMKTRIIAKDFSALLAHGYLLNPLPNGAAAIALWSHKLLRWLAPYFLLMLLAVNVCLLSRAAFRLIFAAQIAFYSAALIGWLACDRRQHSLWSIPMSFCLVNLAALIGTVKAIARRSSGAWKPDRDASHPPDFRVPAPTRAMK
jgi:cellulose synthase/poly-beta-1,6-N-acetylglucosamine synthase-like glycosyltransferase